MCVSDIYAWHMYIWDICPWPRSGHMYAWDMEYICGTYMCGTYMRGICIYRT